MVRSHHSGRPIRARLGSIVTAVLLLGPLACGDSTGPEVDRLSEQRSLWEAQSLEDYTFDVRRVCFCPFREEGVRLTVVAGVLTGATDLATDKVLEPNEVQWYLTIDGLFDLLEDAYDQDAARVDVDFDASRGYPTSIWIDYSEMIADEELGFTLLTEVRTLEPN